MPTSEHHTQWCECTAQQLSLVRQQCCQALARERWAVVARAVSCFIRLPAGGNGLHLLRGDSLLISLFCGVVSCFGSPRLEWPQACTCLRTVGGFALTLQPLVMLCLLAC
jgi:hypothetical protein